MVIADSATGAPRYVTTLVRLAMDSRRVRLLLIMFRFYPFGFHHSRSCLGSILRLSPFPFEFHPFGFRHSGFGCILFDFAIHVHDWVPYFGFRGSYFGFHPFVFPQFKFTFGFHPSRFRRSRSCLSSILSAFAVHLHIVWVPSLQLSPFTFMFGFFPFGFRRSRSCLGSIPSAFAVHIHVWVSCPRLTAVQADPPVLAHYKSLLGSHLLAVFKNDCWHNHVPSHGPPGLWTSRPQSVRP